jgi:hypothetical protein
MKNMKLNVTVCLVLCACVLLWAAGCGSEPLPEPKHKKVSRDEIKERVDNATQELDKSVKDVDVKTNDG